MRRPSARRRTCRAGFLTLEAMIGATLLLVIFLFILHQIMLIIAEAEVQTRASAAAARSAQTVVQQESATDVVLPVSGGAGWPDGDGIVFTYE